MFSVNKSPCLVPESPVSLFNCVMGNFAGFPEIMNVTGNFYFSLFSAQFFEIYNSGGDRGGFLDHTFWGGLVNACGANHCYSCIAKKDFLQSRRPRVLEF